MEAWSLGWALSARGELGIVLGLLAWQHGVIRERLFVAIVTLAIVTSGLAGPMLKWLLRREKLWTLGDLLDVRSCLLGLSVQSPNEVISTLAILAAERAKLNPDDVTRAVLDREAIMGTGLGQGIAVPHARISGLTAPVLVVGTSARGVAFGGVDDEPVRLIFLCLTPEEDAAAQLQIMAAIGRLAREPSLLLEAMAARNATELLGVLRVAEVLQK